MELEQVISRAAWLGRDIQNSDEWIYRLSDAEIAEIDAALRHLQSTGQQISTSRKSISRSSASRARSGFCKRRSRTGWA